MRSLDDPHRRLNPLTGRSVLVSAGRTARPWLGRQEPPPPARPNYDPGCYLCPGNERANGERNPDYEGTFVFTNDFPALRPDTVDASSASPHRLLTTTNASGTCRVLCFSPRHDLDLAQMSVTDVRRVVDLWVEQVDELSGMYGFVQVFENRGEEMGASNPHPHGQVWATGHVPDEPALEDERQRAWLDDAGAPLLFEYADIEARDGSRVVVSNAGHPKEPATINSASITSPSAKESTSSPTERRSGRRSGRSGRSRRS